MSRCSFLGAKKTQDAALFRAFENSGNDNENTDPRRNPCWVPSFGASACLNGVWGARGVSLGP